MTSDSAQAMAMSAAAMSRPASAPPPPFPPLPPLSLSELLSFERIGPEKRMRVMTRKNNSPKKDRIPAITTAMTMTRTSSLRIWVSSCASIIAEQVLPLLDAVSDRRFSEPNRWGGSGLEEQPLRPELVVEVRYDKVQGHRFRHGTKLLRFRPDKDPRSCTWTELRPPRDHGGPTVGDLLER